MTQILWQRPVRHDSKHGVSLRAPPPSGGGAWQSVGGIRCSGQNDATAPPPLADFIRLRADSRSQKGEVSRFDKLSVTFPSTDSG
ncbi:MAG: hypothetical protein ACP5JH_09355 [Bacteroidota bacterium]